MNLSGWPLLFVPIGTGGAGMLIVVVIVVALAVMFMYNRLVRLRQNVQEAWSAIDTELRRRYDLIPNIVQVVKGYATHERDTLEAVIAARNAAASNTGPPAAQAQAENALTGAMRQLFAVSEAYPDLKANQNFLSLQGELSETENRISQARRFYNANVRELNTAVETFPTVLLARSFGFQPAEYFETEESTTAPVSVAM